MENRTRFAYPMRELFRVLSEYTLYDFPRQEFIDGF